MLMNTKNLLITCRKEKFQCFRSLKEETKSVVIFLTDKFHKPTVFIVLREKHPKPREANLI